MPTRGLIAAAFDHPDTRTGDPNLHTHVVVANKVQGLDGKWRSVDSRALHHAVVSISEVYDNLFADELARRLPVSWQWRERGPRRSPAYELSGISDPLLALFSTRSTAIDEAMSERVTDFTAARGRHPNRVETLRLRQQVTRETRPNKQAHPIAELMESWRTRATIATGSTQASLPVAPCAARVFLTRTPRSHQTPLFPWRPMSWLVSWSDGPRGPPPASWPRPPEPLATSE